MDRDKLKEALRRSAHWVCPEDKDIIQLNVNTAADRILPTLKEEKLTFQKALEKLINQYSQENGSDTPDFMLAEYLVYSLAAFNMTVREREKWYGRGPVIKEDINL
jgi:hypothetical protein